MAQVIKCERHTDFRTQCVIMTEDVRGYGGGITNDVNDIQKSFRI